MFLAWAGQSQAQYEAVGDDGIAASPKFRQMLNERKAMQSAVGAAEITEFQPVGDAEIAASPKFREMLNERTPASASYEGSPPAGYQPVGSRTELLLHPSFVKY